jgi:beta-lactamase class A
MIKRDPIDATRRDLLLATMSFLLSACASSTPSPSAPMHDAQPDASAELARIETAVGGRVGVFALDTATGRTLAHRADERFAMCSTFKWVLAAAAFARIDRGDGTLDERIPFSTADLFEQGSAVTSQHVAEGAMTVEALARAAVTVSDNTAANLLLARVGGPAGLTAFIRQVGDPVTRLDRNEPTLNSNDPGDERDTTSPRAMVGLMKAVLVGSALKAASRERLVALLQACETGKKRLRAGFPTDWVIGDKTGTGNFAFNDLAIAIPPGRAPILISAYMSDPGGPDDDDGARHEAGDVAIARLVARQLAG